MLILAANLNRLPISSHCINNSTSISVIDIVENEASFIVFDIDFAFSFKLHLAIFWYVLAGAGLQD